MGSNHPNVQVKKEESFALLKKLNRNYKVEVEKFHIRIIEHDYEIENLKAIYCEYKAQVKISRLLTSATIDKETCMLERAKNKLLVSACVQDSTQSASEDNKTENKVK